ncbi:hypothetical protein BKM31_00210 [[Actinomadura] parvosata subsp. kistnae]|uniref:Uncharacterized protein n=1 Tax=[Actinomadura] parvosata subsp. kistnae TaxID=1909395 RepID=A0A1U9ZQD2_9ACTN|nr:hypothetical protein BKM31_00210 [Nonomuraea sp. ATCC 55076]
MEAVLTGTVTALTTRRPSARARSKKRSYMVRASPLFRASGRTPTKWMYASSGSDGDRMPIRKPARAPSAVSATWLVPWKWSRKSRGRAGRIGRPHQPSITAAMAS